MNVMSPPRLEVPEVLSETHYVDGPRQMMITGEAEEAIRVNAIHDQLSKLIWNRDNIYFHTAGTEMLVLALEYGIDKERIASEQPGRLISGYGLEPRQSTEALFVGPEDHRNLRLESIAWLGSAVAREHIERVYYLGDPEGCAALGSSRQIQVISDPLDVFRLVSKQDGSEIPYSTAHKLAETTA